jgi:hypothetical protein
MYGVGNWQGESRLRKTWQGADFSLKRKVILASLPPGKIRIIAIHLSINALMSTYFSVFGPGFRETVWSLSSLLS